MKIEIAGRQGQSQAARPSLQAGPCTAVLEPGKSVSAIALRRGVNVTMLFKWRLDHLRRTSSLHAAVLPTQLAPEVEAPGHPASPAVPPPSRPPARGGVIELEIAGAQPRLRSPAHEDSLRSVLRALRHST